MYFIDIMIRVMYTPWFVSTYRTISLTLAEGFGMMGSSLSECSLYPLLDLRAKQGGPLEIRSLNMHQKTSIPFHLFAGSSLFSPIMYFTLRKLINI